MAGVESLIVDEKPKETRPAIDREKVMFHNFRYFQHKQFYHAHCCNVIGNIFVDLSFIVASILFVIGSTSFND